MRWVNARWKELRREERDERRVEESQEDVHRDDGRWEELTRGEKVVGRAEKWLEELRQEVRSRGKSMEVCCSSYRQTFSLDPITSQSLKFLNLETSATRLANWLNPLMSIDVNWFWIRNHPKRPETAPFHRSISLLRRRRLLPQIFFLSEVMSDMLDGKNCWKYLYRCMCI